MSKYHRRYPVREIDPNQTAYSLVKSINENNRSAYYSFYYGKKKTYAELIDEADLLAERLAADGVKADDVIGVCMMTVPEIMPVMLGINKIGAVSCWMDATAKSEDIKHYICDLKMRVLIVYEPLVPVFIGAVSGFDVVRIIVVKAAPQLGVPNLCESVGSPLIKEFVDYINEASKCSLAEPAPYAEGRTRFIVHSSGSTGKSKAIAHSDYNFNSEVCKMAYADLPFYEGKRALVCAPPWVIYGLVNSVYSTVVFGGEVVFTTIPQEDMIYAHLGSFDYVYGVPVYYRYLYNKMKELRSSGSDEFLQICKTMRSLSALISGGDKIPEEELIEWQLMFDCIICNGYGNNEMTGAAVVSPMLANRPGSIGIAMKGISAKTCDVNTGHLLSDGEQGELCLSSDSMFLGYIGNEEETRRIKRNHNGRLWIHTGDLAVIDGDGFIYLKGRTRRLIIDKLGYKISPENSERLIQELEYVNECIVVGAKLAENNTVPFAFVELLDTADKTAIDEITELCLKNLKEYERPKFFHVLEKIPHKSNGGKVDFLALEALANELIKSEEYIN